jgi:hypothetical protein
MWSWPENYSLIHFNDIIENIILSKKDCQIDCIYYDVLALDKLVDFDKIISKIIRITDAATCKYIAIMISNEKISMKDDFINYFNTLLNLKSEYQAQTFLDILNLDFDIDSRYLHTIQYSLQKANKAQCDAIYELCENEFLDSKNTDLMKMILLFKSQRLVSLATLVLLNVNNLGRSKVIKLIDMMTYNNDINLDKLEAEIRSNIKYLNYDFEINKKDIEKKSLFKTLKKDKNTINNK